MIELRVGRRQRPNPTALILASASGAIAASTVRALTKASRRSRARDRLTSAASHTADLMSKAARDAKNRASGAAAVAKSAGRHQEVSDEKLVARVRSKLGRLVSHPHAIEVHASNGQVLLEGPILKSEVDHLIRQVRKIRGVEKVGSKLEVHEHAGDVPALQGPGRPPRAPEIFQEHWTPSLRVGAGAVGAAALISGAVRGARTSGLGLSAIGGLLLARAIVDEPIGRILGLGGTRRSVEIQKTITIGAPVEQVYSYWANFEHFPEFMDHVQKVTKTGGGRSHWRIRGPLGADVEFDAEITSVSPNHHLAWRSSDRSLVKHAGIVRFESVQDGRATRVDVHLSYNPIAGYLGHAIATLFRVDPKKALDDDLLRMKSLLEEGKATAHGRELRREEGAPPPSAGMQTESVR